MGDQHPHLQERIGLLGFLSNYISLTNSLLLSSGPGQTYLLRTGAVIIGDGKDAC